MAASLGGVEQTEKLGTEKSPGAFLLAERYGLLGHVCYCSVAR